MYLSADRLAIANQTALETFEQSSIAWQAIPHWDTGDPGQTQGPQRRNQRSGLPGPRYPSTNDFPTNARPDERADAGLAARRSDRVEPPSSPRQVDTSVLKELTTEGLRAVIRLHLDVGPEARGHPEGAHRRPSESRGRRVSGAVLPAHEYRRDSSEAQRLRSGYPVTDATAHRGEHQLAAPGVAISTKNRDRSKLSRILVLVERRQLDRARGCRGRRRPARSQWTSRSASCPSVEVVGETYAGRIELAVRVRFVDQGQGYRRPSSLSMTSPDSF